VLILGACVLSEARCTMLDERAGAFAIAEFSF